MVVSRGFSRGILLVPLILSTSLNSFAASRADEYSKAYQDCISKVEVMDDMVIHTCASGLSEKIYSDISKKINSLRELYLQGSPQDAEMLERSQKQWSAYKDLQCELSGNHIGSPMYSLCPMLKGIQRLKEIDELLDQ